MKKIVVTQKVEQLLENICTYISNDNCAEVASQQKTRIKKEIARLSYAPNIGEVIRENYRKLSIPPYIVIYRIGDDKVYIINILDGRRNMQKIIFSKK